MSYLHPEVLDALLDEIKDATHIHICSQMPSNHTEATDTYSLGNDSAPSMGTNGAGDPDGREFEVAAVTDGSVTDDGTASHVALVDGTRLLLGRALSSTQVVTEGNPFTLTAFTVRVPAP